MKQQYGIQSEQTMKDAHSPAGQLFFATMNYEYLPDCPVCKYGTPINKNGKLICIDCGAKVGTTDKQTK